MSDLPSYVTRPGEAVHLQPFQCANTQMYGFYLRGDKAAIQQRLVDPVLNTPTDGGITFRAISDLVLLSFAMANRCTSTLAPDSRFGWVPEGSWTLWVPVVTVKRELGIEVAQSLYFYPAYITVDNSWSVAAGREIYGFPKGYGPVELPLQGQHGLRFAASTLVMERYGPDSEGQVRPVIEVTQTEAGTAAGAVWQDIEDAVGAIAHLLTGSGAHLTLPGLNFAHDLARLAREEEVPGVFLKQFRDVADGSRACYQAIVAAGSFVDRFNGGGLLTGTFEATIADFDSHPIARDLGLAPGAQRLEFPFWVNMDFTIGQGSELWTAGQ
ncbi:acetoacetate decarboxylase [Novosphingobium kunmingense]|uniref:Acetoacetate decarboxylase n=1 Tax=Novosphingobium kunmingense TaxID=1211806 RepID=A0A2N0I272_9SPHN|nr:acetoacetate decarboxylase family protein [Novosphingobium kunmingense]PKB25272.1 acetoacetate decarboxylase [Novosphingobium kunmingense]